MEIVSAKRWANGKDVRIYIIARDAQGVEHSYTRYLTGNPWHAAKSWGTDAGEEGKPDAETVAEYLRLTQNGKESYIADSPALTKAIATAAFPKAKRGGYCPECGHWAEAGNDLVRVYNADEDRDEWRVFHSDRAVCAANIAADKAAKERREAFKTRLAAFKTCFDNAEMPANAEPTGETMYDTYSVYGTGDRIVIGEALIWWCERNGMDGDNWSRNNGSLGICRCLPRADGLENEARWLAAEHIAIKGKCDADA